MAARATQKVMSTVNALVTPETLRPGDVDSKPADEDKRFYSVTTVLGALNKPALVYWAANETAEAAIRQAPFLQQRVEAEGKTAVAKALAGARFASAEGQRTAAELGTAAHAAFEEYSLTGIKPEVDEEVQPFLDQFDKWAQKWQPEYVAAEAAVYNETYGIAGTLDAIAKIDGQLVIVDYKTSKKSIDARGKVTGPYPEAALQLAAYRHAEFVAVWRARRFEQYKRRYYLLNDDEREMAQPMFEVDGAVVLHVTPEHADLYPVKTGDDVWEAFQYAIEIFRWENVTSKGVIGSPLTKGS
jgi:hypothetical protein